MAQSVTEQFKEALKYLLAREGRGAQTRLAGQQNIDRGYLNAIIKGRKPGSEEVRARVAAHFDMAYEDMLFLGRRILGGEDILAEGNREEEQKTPTSIDVAGERRVSDYKARQRSKGQTNISEKIMKVVEILESDTAYGDILADLVDAFHEAVNTGKDNLGLRNQVKEMELRIASLEKMLANKKAFTQKSA